MNKEQREHLQEWLDPMNIYCPDELGEVSTLSSAMHVLCEEAWRSADEYVAMYDCDSKEFRKEAACIIVGHFLDVMLRNDCLDYFDKDIIKHLIERCGEELMNGR